MRLTVACVGLLLGISAAAGAQELARPPYSRPQHATASLAAGLTHWELDGAGSLVILAARVDTPLGLPWLLGEGSLATFRAQDTYLIPEVQLQLQIPRAVAPYVGAGVGAITWKHDIAGRESELTTSVAAGVRVWGVISRGVLRGEIRLRGVGEQRFAAAAAEWTAGIGWSF